VFQAQLASETGAFDFDDVATAIVEKLIRRHPHVFGDLSAATPEAVKATWDAIKAEERRLKGDRPAGVLDTVPVTFPALLRAQKMQAAMATVGFDWPDRGPVVAKIAEEVAEFTAAAASGDRRETEAEFGDLLFSLVNLARHAGVDADAALRATNAKFAARVRHMEAAAAADGSSLAAEPLARQEERWVSAKRAVHSEQPQTD
jgi:nucleoside triphosphate diphosphatase